MKIHRVKLEHVRNIKEVWLDLSKPLTVIAGRNGIGKTAVQEALLAAMFERDKKSRDSLISDFDPHSPPMATLHLSRGEPEPTITLSRDLTGKDGEWREGGTIIKAKGAALQKIQESLPISADAAATLLWGQQEEISRVLEDFPADGHSLLTAATVKGSGPDPKQVMQELERQFKEAKRAGKNPGALTRATEHVRNAEHELQKAQDAEVALNDLTKKYEQAKDQHKNVKEQAHASKKRVRHLERIERLLDAALNAENGLSELEKTEQQWGGLDEEIGKSRRSVRGLEEELERLRSQYRVAKDAELADQIDRLKTRIRLAEKAEGTRRDLQEHLDVRKRPDKSDLEDLRKLQADRKSAARAMQATGVRYALSVENAAKTVRVSEENRGFHDVPLTPAQTHEGIVGTVVIRADGLQLAASGKEDIAALKASRKEIEDEIAQLLHRFGVGDQEGFLALNDERSRMEIALGDARVELSKHLRDDTLDSLNADVELLETARRTNKMTHEDKERWAKTVLRPMAEIEKTIIAKQSAFESANDRLGELETKRPTDAQKKELQSKLSDARRNANRTRDAFLEEDEEQRQPSPALRDQIKKELQNEGTTRDRLIEGQNDAEKDLTRLSTELKHAGPDRPIDSIKAELDEALAALHREEVLQAAREKLRQRIDAKIVEMSKNVPRELAAEIGKHLTELTRGAYAKVNLNERLQVASVSEGGQQPVEWEPHKLSAGERALTALTVKVAVARALADLGSPVFVILDDSLVALDPQYRAATEEQLLRLVADGKLQVILITCHTDWVVAWKERYADKVHYIDFAQQAEYYRTPRALAAL